MIELFYIGRPVVRTDGRAYGHVITKFSQMGRLPHFLTHGAPLRALRARELRYDHRICHSRVKMSSTNWAALNVRVIIANLIEHCRANAETMGSNPAEDPKYFYRVNLQLYLRFKRFGGCLSK